MMYRQITFAERHTLGLLRRRGLSAAAIAQVLGRHRSSIGREIRRNRATSDGGYRPQLADWYARGRRSRSRRNLRFSPGNLQRVRMLLEAQWSPEQIAGRLRRDRLLQISHETNLGGPACRRAPVHAPAHCPAAAAQALRHLRAPRTPRGEASDHGTPRSGRGADAGRALGGGHDARSRAGRALRADPG